MGLAYDAHWAWRDLLSVVPVVRRWRDLGMVFIEDPFPSEQVALSIGLREQTGERLALGEDGIGRWAFHQILEQQRPDVLRVDATLMGGISEAIKVCALAATLSVPVLPHVFPQIHIHLAAAYPGILAVEMTDRAYETESLHRVFRDWVTVADGDMLAPDRARPRGAPRSGRGGALHGQGRVVPVRLQGRVAIVTGASRGIGRAIAIGLAGEGARVVVNFATRGELAHTVADEIVAAGGEAIAVGGDVSDAADVDRLVRATVDRFGALDILVNNAALTEVHRPWYEISEDDWDRTQAVNLKGCFLMFRAAYPHLRDSGHGRVINISSVTFLVGHKRLAHYVASKGGVIGLTRALAREVGGEGITVNAITPGAIQTEAEIFQFPDQEHVLQEMAQLQSIPRRGLPTDIADGVVFLAGDGASFITGQTLNIDGGWALH